MLKRPLILKLFALFLFLDPLLRVTFISIESEFAFFTVLQKTFTLDTIDIFNFWLLFPISGLLILSVKLYSYLFFIIIQMYSFYFHINYESYSWPYLSETPSITAYMLVIINFFMVIYLLMPRSRELFFDKNLRWWERGSRYSIDEPCFARISGREIHGKICDLSYGGALIQLDEQVEEGKTIQLDFDILNKSLAINAKVVRILDGENRFGTQFIFKNYWQKFTLKLIMLTIVKLGRYNKFR